MNHENGKGVKKATGIEIRFTSPEQHEHYPELKGRLIVSSPERIEQERKLAEEQGLVYRLLK